jgi:pilus assembly protein CpaF
MRALLPTAANAFAVVRRSRALNVTLDDLVRSGAISRKIASLLSQYIRHRANILLVGPRDSGIEELRAALVALAPAPLFTFGTEELGADAPHVVALGGAQPDARRLFEVAFRCSGARVAVGLSDAEGMLASIEAMSAGSDGVIASIHAPTASRALSRLSGAIASRRAGLSTASARDWVASCVNLVVEVSRLGDGRSRALRVAEPGFAEHGEVMLKDIFAFHVERTAAGGAIEGTFIVGGMVPRFIEELNARGVGIDTSMFSRPPSR